eukprot:1198929-Pleurochrysis_carterae.AAC.4
MFSLLSSGSVVRGGQGRKTVVFASAGTTASRSGSSKNQGVVVSPPITRLSKALNPQDGSILRFAKCASLTCHLQRGKSCACIMLYAPPPKSTLSRKRVPWSLICIPQSHITHKKSNKVSQSSTYINPHFLNILTKPTSMIKCCAKKRLPNEEKFIVTPRLAFASNSSDNFDDILLQNICSIAPKVYRPTNRSVLTIQFSCLTLSARALVVWTLSSMTLPSMSWFLQGTV